MLFLLVLGYNILVLARLPYFRQIFLVYVRGGFAAFSAFGVVLYKYNVLRDKTGIPGLAIFSAYWTLASTMMYCVSSMIPSGGEC